MPPYPGSAPPSRWWLKAGLYGLGLWLVLVFVAAFAALGRIRSMASGDGAYVSLGPLHCIYVQKAAMEGGGYTLTIHVRPGLFVLLALCVAVELLAIWLVRRYLSQKQSTDA